MNTLTAASLVGKDACYLGGPGTIKFAVTILDVRRAYGRIDLLIEPCGCAGSRGEAWVSEDKVELLDKDKGILGGP